MQLRYYEVSLSMKWRIFERSRHLLLTSHQKVWDPYSL